MKYPLGLKIFETVLFKNNLLLWESVGGCRRGVGGYTIDKLYNHKVEAGRIYSNQVDIWIAKYTCNQTPRINNTWITVELGNKNFTRCKLFVFMFFCGYNHVIIFPSWRLSVAQMWISSVFTTITGHSSAKGLYTWTSYLGGCWYKCK